MSAAVHVAAGFHPVTNDAATTMSALWCECVNRALKGIEGVTFA